MIDFASALLEQNVLFAIAASILSLAGFLPYLRQTARQITKPERASWLIWSVLSSIAFVSQAYEGATLSLGFAGAQALGTILVFLLSIRCGKGRYFNKTDRYVLMAAALGLTVWFVSDSAAITLLITVIISFLGGSLTIIKAYFKPQSETMITWVLFFAASICAILSMRGANWVLLTYPLYLLSLNGTILAALVLGRTLGARPVAAAGMAD